MTLEFTVSEITKIFQNFVHETFMNIKIRGEISEVSKPKSGHIYFILKDKNALLNAICWKETQIQVDCQEGMEVICSGYLTTYRSKYQLIVIDILNIGKGSVQLEFEKKKQKLEKEGLFDKKHKKTLPILPKKLGIITSKTGAVIHDIIHRVKSRFPNHILIWTVSVQGAEACKEITNALRGFNSMTENLPDIIIIARGGGSVEDLWIFNEESIVRAVVASKIPIISAIGHEQDLTLIDYAADVCAPTPTAAIEIALPVKFQLLESLKSKSHRINAAMKNKLTAYNSKLMYFYSKLVNPTLKITILSTKINTYKNSIDFLFHKLLSQKKQLLEKLFLRICYYDQKRLLEIGYTIVYNNHNNHILTAKSLNPSDEIIIKWKDGIHKATIISNHKT